MTDYKELCEDVRAYTEGVPHLIANLANASALLWQRLSEIVVPIRKDGKVFGVLEETLF